ncbi:MAG TPA: MBL fold metallo-hydrolase [Nitrososphaerales archaeon]|nr:MBL fold metallo-hydrolase [Nitrososphaerales archaeon]
MPPRITCYGGVGEIGGNKFILEDRGVKVILDFGTGFSEGSDYFDSSISPRGVNGAGDLFEFDLLPQIPGLYSEGALQNTNVEYTEPEFDAVVLSHYHSDHTGRIEYIDPKIPVYCGETTSLIHDAYSASTGSPLRGHPIRKFRTGDRFTIGPMEFRPIHVDHSIPGAYGFVIHTSGGTMIYTGDFRFHGPAGSMTKDLVDSARQEKPKLLLTEGTRVTPKGDSAGMSESAVKKEALKMVRGTRSLVFSTFRGNDVDRVNTFFDACLETGRRLVVSMKVAMLLEKLSADRGLRVPRVGRDVDVYLRRKKTGKFDDSDYYAWERPFIARGLTSEDVRRRQGEVFLHLEAWNFPELIDIKPDRGGTYIHAATEAFNEEGEKEETLIRNWVEHVGFRYAQLHASGHAPGKEVGELVRTISAKKVVPIHTEFPQLFGQFNSERSWVLEPPVRAKAVSIGP